MASVEYFGKYKAKVVDLNDPEKRGRIRVQCPKVLGDSKSSWCEPCIPVAYEKGGDFCLPKLGDTVWVEFEEGDANQPIWVGNWWSSDNTPLSSYGNAPKTRIIEFDGARLTMSGGALTISAGGGTIEMKNGVINIVSGRVNIN